MPKFRFPNSQLPTSNSQSGQSTIYIVIIIVVVIFAVMLTGGTKSLLSGNIATSVTHTPIPTVPLSPTSSPAPSTSPTNSPAQWSIVFEFKGCNYNGLPGGEIRATGAGNGYISLEIENGSSYEELSTTNFISPASIVSATLPNPKGFNTKKWRLNLFSGGSLNSGVWRGGTQQATFQGLPTNC